ncbi:MAG: toll/interleukin-1 receptor domain-containing protein [Hyphomonadaceae bacterium]|nr:toll/interleukin-1 receptor domain-containing protein [Hyphomonadaceae bacterium]
MSNGFLLAAQADLPDLHDIASGFGLEAVSAQSFGTDEAAATAMQSAANVGIVLTAAATRDANYIALLQVLSRTLRSAQLILADPDVRAAFGFLPQAWPVMAMADAQARAIDLLRRRTEAEGGETPPRAHPLPPVEEAAPPTPAPDPEPEPQPEQETAPDLHGGVENEAPAETDDAPAPGSADDNLAPVDEGVTAPAPETDEPLSDAFGGGYQAPAEQEAAPRDSAPEPPAPPASVTELETEAARPQAPTPAPATPPPIRERGITVGNARAAPSGAPADATAFAPKKLRRGTPELVRIVLHQPKDLKAVIKEARKIDPTTDAAPSGMKIGEVPLGASVGVMLEVRGASCEGAVQRRTWQGEPIDFNFSAEAEDGVKQAVFLARVFVDDAQIGVLAFTRPIGGPKKNAASADSVRLKRHKRVFLSYSSKDRETVSAIATAYAAAGVEHFFDRTSLKSGEEWSPRLRREIDRADLFHLCWSKSAAASEWVEKETEHALGRNKRSKGKQPEITVQMLDGPPWAPHPRHLDSINFDDFVRAAIVGYARGDGSS